MKLDLKEKNDFKRTLNVLMPWDDIKDDFYYPTEQDVKENREKVFKFEIKEHIKTYIKIFQEVL